MSNSSLVNYTKISPNKSSPRNHTIDTITIHCVAGNCTIETVGSLFAQESRQASSNYGIGSDGRIGLFVDEKDRSWCTSSAANDNRAVTIEVANDGGADTGWHVSDTALNGIIILVADICERNGIKKLLWKGDKNLIGNTEQQNMTVHRWLAAKACPGDYLYSKHGYIAEEVNKLLGTKQPVLAVPVSTLKTITEIAQEVIKGLWGNGVERTNRLTAAGYNPTDVQKKVNSVLIGTTSVAVEFKPYLVRITAAALNVRDEPSTNSNSKIVKCLLNDENQYTIIAESDGQGAKKWGKLKSGLGWISLDYTKKV